MPRVVTTASVDAATLAEVMRPRTGVVAERAMGDGRFEAASGPVRSYRRTVRATAGGPDRWLVEQTVEFRVAAPWFGVLFVIPLRRLLGRLTPPQHLPWWAPPDTLDARGATSLSTLAVLSVVAGYMGTLLTQTITFAADDFGADEAAQGVALATVRADIVLTLLIIGRADRAGRRNLLLATTAIGCVLTATGALAPALPWLTGSQVLARAFVTATAILVGVVAAEEMPAGSRAYAVSLLAMAAALGAGLAVMLLPLADLASWRVLYLVPIVALPLVAAARRHLPESRRFRAPHAEARLAGHGRRFWLLAAAGMLLALFTAPAAQFQNEYLREERGFSAARISLFSLATNTPGAIGVIVGGRLADTRGRRAVGAIAIAGGVGATVATYLVTGWPLWAWSVAGAVVGSATVPALGVYGPELFPTSLRGRANASLAAIARAGSVAGLLAAGFLATRMGSLGPAMAVLAVGPALVGLLVITAFPETAHRELEELNPEDTPPAAPVAGPDLAPDPPP